MRTTGGAPPAHPAHPAWMTWLLWAAGIYNLAWGAVVILLPWLPFQLAHLPLPNYPEIWQCLGMVVGVYGAGYIIAAYDPLRHWPIVLVGLLGKVLGPIGMVWSITTGRLPLVAGLLCATNDLIWWLPFGLILYRAYLAAAPSNQPHSHDYFVSE